MNKIWAAPVLILFMISAWFHYQTQLQIRELQQRNLAVNQQLVAVAEQLAQVSAELVKFEANSLDGMVRDANDALLSGWESLVNTVGEELKKARQPIAKQSSQKPPVTPATPAPPVLESPDGTDRI
jgi:hypothetical protein